MKSEKYHEIFFLTKIVPSENVQWINNINYLSSITLGKIYCESGGGVSIRLYIFDYIRANIIKSNIENELFVYQCLYYHCACLSFTYWLTLYCF